MIDTIKSVDIDIKVDIEIFKSLFKDMKIYNITLSVIYLSITTSYS